MEKPLAPDTHYLALQPPVSQAMPRVLKHHPRWHGEEGDVDERYWLRSQDSWTPLLIPLGGLLDSIPLLGLSFFVCNLGYLENIPETCWTC